MENLLNRQPNRSASVQSFFAALASAYAAILLTACGATGQQFTRAERPGNGEAVIYVYRPKQYMASARSIPISIDNVEVGELKNAGFVRIVAKPGHHTIQPRYGASGLDAPDIEIDVPSSRTLFVRYTIIGKPVPGISAHTAVSSMAVVGDAEAIAELKDLRESK